MKIIERMIDGEVYRIISVGRFNSASTGKLSDEVKAYLADKKLAAKWSDHKEFGLFLESVEAFQKEAERLFGIGDVGVLVFINDTEPDLPLDEIPVKKGDIVEIAYAGEGPAKAADRRQPHSGRDASAAKDGGKAKTDFFESGDKRGYGSPYKQSNEWRKPKGVK